MPLESPEIAALVKKFSPFFSEVRRRLILIVLVFSSSSIIGFAFYERIVKFIIDTLSLTGVNIVFTSPFQFINLAMSSGVATGLIITLPFFITQVLGFLKPALRKTEYRTLVRFIPFSFILFLIGFIFGAMIMKWQIQIFMTRTSSLGIGNIIDISSLLTTVLLTSTLMGVGFQFPIVLLLLIKFGILKRQQLEKQRRWVYLGSLIFTVFLPPESILADLFLSLPLILLFELTLVLGKFSERKKPN